MVLEPVVGWGQIDQDGAVVMGACGHTVDAVGVKGVGLEVAVSVLGGERREPIDGNIAESDSIMADQADGLSENLDKAMADIRSWLDNTPVNGELVDQIRQTTGDAGP